ncbi:MAG: chemoreceptor glutamine deamidase CheD [Gammaproteobacteria bacterium]
MAQAKQNPAGRCYAPPVALPGFSHINRYWDKVQQLYAAKILPGQFYVTRHDEMIITVLGSCIAVCIRDVRTGVGGMNHFMLPEAAQDGMDATFNDAARYGTYAMELLINEILKHGGERRYLEAKVFGGGRILQHMTDIGQRNIAFTREYLVTEQLRVVAADVGDVYPRKVQFFPISGTVRVKKLRSLHNKTIIERETDYLNDLVKQPVAGEIDLF